MTGDLPEIEESDHLLAQTARMDFAFARHVQQQALESHDPKELADLARAYTRLTRSLRQELALLARLKAERAKAEREREQHAAWLAARTPEPDLREVAVEARTHEVQVAVDRVISAAAAGDEKLHTDWCHRFDRELDDWTEADDWLVDDVDAVIRRACATLGLPEDLAARWRNLPEPTFFPDPEPETAEEIAAATAAARETLAAFRSEAARRHSAEPPTPRVPRKDSG